MSEPSIREDFVSDGHSLTRILSVDGFSGRSVVALQKPLPEDSSYEDLQTLWDEMFLKAAVSYSKSLASERTIRIADVFCGAGGLSYGVRDAINGCGLRAESILAVDFDPTAVEVYRRNFDPRYFSTCNLWTSVTKSYATRNQRLTFLGSPRLLTDELNATKGSVDILLGGPPCEGHSTSNNITRRNDPRNRYYVVMPAIAAALDAKAVIVENVPGIRHDRRSVLDNAKELFKTSGYQVDEAIVDAISLGLPQTRKRHILVACKDGRPRLETIVEALKRPQRSLKWAIGDLVEIDSDSALDSGADLSEVNRRRIKYLFDNDKYDLPNDQRPDSHRDGHTYPSIYGRLQWDAPAGTITTGFNTPGRGRYIHPEIQRTITAHEAARIQGLPDAFEFKLIGGETPTRTSLANMIGDAVPPQMGYLAGVAALAAMDLGTLQSC